MTKKEELIRAVNEYFEDPKRGGSGGCNDYKVVEKCNKKGWKTIVVDSQISLSIIS